MGSALEDAAGKPALAVTLEQEVQAQESLAASEDFAEGARAFFEQREPEFAGRQLDPLDRDQHHACAGPASGASPQRRSLANVPATAASASSTSSSGQPTIDGSDAGAAATVVETARTIAPM